MFEGGLWSVSAIDAAFNIFVLIVVIGIVSYGLQWVIFRQTWAKQSAWMRLFRRERKHFLTLVGVVVAVLGTYMAYGTFRNQMRQSAEEAGSSDTSLILEWERERPFIRCLYTWYSDVISPAQCLTDITSDSDKFSEALLYVEEVMFVLEKSKRNEDEYKSPYSKDIEYWRRDIEEDPTGLFSFHLVNRYGLSNLQSGADDAGVCIPDLCPGYERVRLALASRGFKVDAPNVCQSPSSRARLRRQCPQ